MKTIEDDPSITPGSVARSPLSIAAKDPDLFATSSKTSPTDLPPLSLSSSTWSFNPTGASQPHFTRYFCSSNNFKIRFFNFKSRFHLIAAQKAVGQMVYHIK